MVFPAAFLGRRSRGRSGVERAPSQGVNSQTGDVNGDAEASGEFGEHADGGAAKTSNHTAT